MAIAASLLTSAGDNADHAALDPFVTASITPTGPVLMGLSFATDQSPTIEPSLPASVQGCSLAWAHVADVYYKTAGLNMRAKMALWQGTGTPSTGAISLYFNYVCVGCQWNVVDIPGADPAGLIVGGQIATDAASTPAGAVISATLPIGTANDAGDRCFAFVSGQNAVSSYTPRANWTELAEVPKGTPSMTSEVQWRSGAFEATGSATNSSASGFPSGIIVVEVAIAPTGGGAGPGTHVMLGLTGVG